MANLKLDEQWAEAFSLLFLAVGFIIAILLQSPFLSYLSVFFAGFVAGRVYYLKKSKEPILPFVLLIVGFLFGYLLGSFWASRFVTLLFFAVGFGISYYLHLKQILVIFKSEDFIK
ncbi:hypothetical protein HOL21_01250 [Candidatus Woesearchaeota archaeon]|jgi:hypothetical protein|nr:hypothetical protein [Candidatus Woesearchaeota archaeon]MBT5396819.1 hypothetical protein [Candidatus Woesearchaeota archaeon]MBT6367707.1 hypothetical protein [Candidatus Woesearchaeota archaeon]MBT7762892.1 hypothetical protein [Candidatus Woesearchaeota archaeon]